MQTPANFANLLATTYTSETPISFWVLATSRPRCPFLYVLQIFSRCYQPAKARKLFHFLLCLLDLEQEEKDTIHFIGCISINLPGIGLSLFNMVESINLDSNDNLQCILHTI